MLNTIVVNKQGQHEGIYIGKRSVTNNNTRAAQSRLFPSMISVTKGAQSNPF